MHRRDIARRRGTAGADRPDRFISDDQTVGVIGQRSGKLTCHSRFGIAGITLSFGFADTDDDLQPGGARRLRLGADVGVGLVAVGAALAVPDDDKTSTGIGQHRCRNTPGMRA